MNKKETTYNLILTCLSTVSSNTTISLAKGESNEYKYYEDDHLITTGVMTNEAGIKYIM